LSYETYGQEILMCHHEMMCQVAKGEASSPGFMRLGFAN